MSQSALPAPVARPQSAGEGPDLLFVVRHYRWLIILGTLFGLAVGVGVYYTLKTVNPKYEAKVTFAARSKAESTPTMQNREGNTEETSVFIRTQVELFKSMPEIWEKVFQTGEVRQSQWFKAAKTEQSARQALKEAFRVAPVPNTNLFEARLILSEREEVAKILNAIASVYVNTMEENFSLQRTNDLKAFEGAAKTAKTALDAAQRDAEEFRVSRDVSGMLNAQTIAVTELSTLAGELQRLLIDQKAIDAAYTKVEADQKSPDYKLPFEYQREVDNDPNVRALTDRKLGLEQERDVSVIQYGKDHPIVKALVIRIEVVDRQLKDVRDREEAKAKARQMQTAAGNLAAIQSRIAEIKKKHDDQQNKIREIEANLVGYRQREENVRLTREAYNNAQEKYVSQQGMYNYTQNRILMQAKATDPDPSEIASPTIAGTIPPGVVAGLLLSFGLAYVLELTNTRVRTPRDITRTMQLPLLGFVPDQGDDDLLQGELSTSIRTAPSSMTAESFRQIRGRLAAQTDGSPLRTILVSSIAPGGGATTVASNLATGLALNGRKVLLVDVNFYRPGIKTIYPNVPAVGFSDLLSDASKLDAAIAPSADLPTLSVMGVGAKAAGGSTELLDAAHCRDLLAKLKERFDVVILDGAPLSLVSDSVSLAAKVDGVVAVVRAGRITRGTVGRVREQLRQVKANLLGIVLNAAQTQSSGYFRKNYETYYRYANAANGSANGHSGARQPAAAN